DEEVNEGLTEEEILEIIENENKEKKKEKQRENSVEEVKISYMEAEKYVNQTLRFLYEQDAEFGEVEEEVKVLRKLHKRVKLNIIKNLKQTDINSFLNAE
ncbi:3864_t:CDS:1, partial [Cetraspora pellucida]